MRLQSCVVVWHSVGAVDLVVCRLELIGKAQLHIAASAHGVQLVIIFHVGTWLVLDVETELVPAYLLLFIGVA